MDVGDGLEGDRQVGSRKKEGDEGWIKRRTICGVVWKDMQ